MRHASDTRQRRFWTLGLAGLVAATLAGSAFGDERKFTVMLAAPVKSFEQWPPAEPLPNPDDAFWHYFDRGTYPNIDSLAEYWDEISYGNVSISGDVFGWAEIPWPVLPLGEFTVPPDATSIAGLILPYADLNNNNVCDEFRGESVPVDQTQMFLIDFNGEVAGTGPGGPGLDVRTDGLFDEWAPGQPIWTPGERFLDMNNDGRYDALLEHGRDGWNSDCELNGFIDDDELCVDADVDEDGKWDFPEPFEDFLIIYYPSQTDANRKWVKLDPSPNNTDGDDPEDATEVGTRAWAEAYIRRNYPGDIGQVVNADGSGGSGFLGRFGNGIYDGPDAWTEIDNSKLQQPPGGLGYSVSGLTRSPRPDADPDEIYPPQYPRWDYEQWWEYYWVHKYWLWNPDIVLLGLVPDLPDAPPWPSILPSQGGGWAPNIPNMQPFDPDNPNLDALVPDRPFNPNVGGSLARTGFECVPESDKAECWGEGAPPVELASPGDGSVDASLTSDSAVVRPDTNGYYDGPAEFDDLASSIYHAWYISGLVHGGDGTFGEVTSPRNTSNFGEDIGSGVPGGGGGNTDSVIPPAGPLAYNVHGANGYDAGNQVSIEYLTWMRNVNPTEVPEFIMGIPTGNWLPAPAVLKRDFNLDGLLDQGEVRDSGTENYAIDLNSATNNNGGGGSEYPYNRQRLVEDTVAALDTTVDWDNLVMPADIDFDGTVYTYNFLHSTVLIPEGLYQSGLAPGGRGLFQLPAPSMVDTPIQIIEEAGGELSPIFFSDFATAMGDVSESSGEVGDPGAWEIPIMCHEWLHVWEGYPDLYDYDVYTGGYENKPVGAWDIMAGGWVHPAPFLKEFGRGSGYLGTTHEPWIDTTDLVRLIPPAQEIEVVLPDFAFNPAGSAFYFENPNVLGERFYFWRLTQPSSSNPREINFSKHAPGEGVMIMHTDFGQQNFPPGYDGNPEGFPMQQSFGTHFAYSIVQADGRQQLENGENSGDPGDPFPGTTGVTEWTENSDPNSRWYGQVRSGIEITNVVEQPEYSVVTFLWKPRVVPSLQFNRPPGTHVVNGDFILGYEAFDFWGGTKIEFYADQDGSGYDGELINPSDLATKVPGVVQ